MQYTGDIFDVDIHHRWNSPDEISGYLPQEWRAYAANVGITPTILHYPFPYGTNKRLDAFGPNGEAPGSSLEILQAQHLDKFGVSRALLGYDAGQEMSHYNIPFTIEISRAANRWSLERWLQQDNRLYGAIMVPSQDPQAAAREIRYWGADSKFLSVLLGDNGLGLPFGHPAYDAIYEAAEDLGLPVSIHFGTPLWGGGGQLAAGGTPLNRLEYFSAINQSGIHHFVSMITSGVFERFPRLKVLLMETGIAWLPALLWQLDGYVDELRLENPQLASLPSEYAREHFLLSTQPLEPGPESEDLADLLSTVDDVAERICFASDYPHFDTDEADYVEYFLPDEWSRNLFCSNAERWFKERLS